MNFKNWLIENWSFPGAEVPDWTPDLEYRLLTEVSTEGLDVKKGAVFIPYCIIAFLPPHKDRFGVGSYELKEVYPICTFSWDESSPIEYGLRNNAQGISYAKKMWSAKFNAYHLLDKPTKNKAYVLCWEKAEEWLQETKLDIEHHPTDPDYDNQ